MKPVFTWLDLKNRGMVRSEEFENQGFTCILPDFARVLIKLALCEKKVASVFFSKLFRKIKPVKRRDLFLRSLQNDYTTNQEIARFKKTVTRAEIVTSHPKRLLGQAASSANVAINISRDAVT